MMPEAALELLQNGDAAGALGLLGETASSLSIDPAHHAARGMVLLANDLPAEALTALRTAVALGDNSPPTLLNLALAEQKAGDEACALEMMESLERRLPEWDEPPLRIAEALRAADRFGDAELAYGRAIEVNPERVSALLGLAGLLILRGEGETARGLLLRCCGIAPGRAEAWDALDYALTLIGDKPLAESSVTEAQRLSPQTLEYALHRVHAARAAGSEVALLAWLEIAGDDDPLNPVLLASKGVLLEHLGRRAEAIDALEAATTLAPDAKLPAFLLGEMLARSDRLSNADGALRRAIELDPANAHLQNMHATVLFRMQRHAEAYAELVASIERNGEHVHELCNLANASTCLGLQDEGVGWARRAIELAPDGQLPRRVLCNALAYRDGITGVEMLAALKECSERLPRESLSPFANTRDPDRPLVVGLLSGSFKAHPVGWLTVAGFETLDPAAFAVTCLAQNGTHDWIARRFRSLAREWHDVDMIDDKQLAMKARELGIDILIDRQGHVLGSRLAILAHRPAPVQIHYMSFPGTIGYDGIDGLIADAEVIPPGDEAYFYERVWRLPRCYYVNDRRRGLPAALGRSTLGLPEGALVLACLNHSYKLRRAEFAIWMRALCAQPRALLWLLAGHPRAQSNLRAEASRAGVDPDRLIFAPMRLQEEHIARLRCADLALDTLPYGAHTTGVDALWAGVPALTCRGSTFAGRVGASLLLEAGLPELIADSLDAYEAKLLELVAKPSLLQEYHEYLERTRDRNPLFDTKTFTRHWEAMLERIYGDAVAAGARHAEDTQCQ
jgi:predicted O-linked N-acetylglucosamine transferase (SPINDLY family)